ncbi:DNA polymerase ligase N-terminal domain-containing protein [Autumnicola psychrophila]|uniref:DNA polymerase ligase N-terminal domain-containing protein n=1 Tax=Autumnicola psychrophila TaxID=3075592 RepID=A0ABU3DVS3_9FLAO|nr:DNA polymerase ligase N-terminal domain-containing protein [Zunongwangia sp. F225]MDT0687539.1 DNA polymerase ligase N-terminal domain-containing protein [Zunongwangia sp. F225]
MAEKELLEKYHEKRNFDISSEPFGNESSEEGEKKPIFVIQKHDATSLHYDFRLLVSGVLKSWAVPKGPSTNPEEKRLAIRTEDHPLEYADFEGIIPENQYGGGTVMVWDAGTYKNEKKDKEGNFITMEEQLKKGRSTFILEGKKIRGAYSLIRIKKGKDENWLLKKVDDDQADARRNPTSTENNSVLTGRSMDDIRKDSEKNG